MKILLTGPKNPGINKKKFHYDMIVWNFLLPLKSLGHTVLFHDTVLNTPDIFTKKVEDFKPDLIFCIFTGDPTYGVFEPWRQVEKITNESDIKTFNWFCDDAWRFDKWSKNACFKFNACSTTERYCIDKYKELGYENIHLSNWHCNFDLYHIESAPKLYEASVLGALYPSRQKYLNDIKENAPDIFEKLYMPGRVSFEEMVHINNMSKVCLSFSANPNGHGKRQMKGRMFEIPAANSLLLTEYTEGLEKFYEPNREAIFFEDSRELIDKLRKLLDRPLVAAQIAQNGFERHKNNYTSEKVLGELLEWIQSL